MISGSISRRYARALLAIGVESGRYEPFGEALQRVAELMQDKSLQTVLENPSILPSRRKAVMAELLTRLGLEGPVRSLCLLLVDRSRTEFIPAIAREYRVMADEHAGRIRASVTSAQALDAGSATRLTRALEEKTGKRVILEQRTDPELIAGLVTTVGSIVYDGSVRTALEQLRHSLLEHEQ